MRVSFPISVREGFAMRERLGAGSGPANVHVRIKLPDGSDYPHLGKIDFVDSQVDRSTDTVLVRATLANPVTRKGSGNARDLIDGAVVTVKIEGSEPQMAVTVPRSAMLVDQQGPYVIVVDKESNAQVRRVRVGQGTAEIAAIDSGLEPGETVVVEGIQRVRPGQPVTATPVVPAARQDRMPK
jgi:membrane fusion protein (multidrug efflux system)